MKLFWRLNHLLSLPMLGTVETSTGRGFMELLLLEVLLYYNLQNA